MPPTLNAAHQHVDNAESYIVQGLLIPAAEEHYLAAEAFKACIEQTADEGAKRMMAMLFNEHSKAGEELQRKIAKLREENKDPSLPQITSPPQGPSLAGTDTYATLGATLRPVPSPPPRRMTDSQGTVDESFMVLGQRSDPGDAFNQFWKIMEGMLDNLSQPVAFATAPLSPDIQVQPLRKDGSSGSDTDHEDSRYSRNFGLGRLRRGEWPNSHGSRSGMGTAKDDVIDLADELDEETFSVEGDELSESFCLIASGTVPSPSSLKMENANLKTEIESMQKRLAATERILQLRKEQDQHLKDSIVLARREAQRAMGASAIGQRHGHIPGDFGPLNLNVSPGPPLATTMNLGRDREAQLLRRVRELEEEVRHVKSENEKQKAMITKFRERWEKLKESAKRKKEAKALAEMNSAAVRERIDEEPEAEEEHTPR